MSTFTTTDFASLLDQAIAAAEQEQHAPSSHPAMPYSMLRNSGDTGATEAAAAAEYLFAAAGDFSVVPDLSVLTAPELPSTDPADIAAELHLTSRESSASLDRIRREFAFSNHPDRVADGVRARAIVRMQIANRLIDDAKQRIGFKASSAR